MSEILPEVAEVLQDSEKAKTLHYSNSSNATVQGH